MTIPPLDVWEIYKGSHIRKLGKVTILDGQKQEDLDKVQAFAKECGGIVFTGIHTETDWSREYGWELGYHRVNRTGRYLVLVPNTYLPIVEKGKTLSRWETDQYNFQRET